MNNIKLISTKTLILMLSTLFVLSFTSISIAKAVNNSTSTKQITYLAKEKNNIDAQYLLGYRYEIGRTVKRNHNKAITWYKKAARKNHLDAQYRIGVLYYKQKKYSKSRYWLAKRAKAGHADAQYYYANTYRYALGTKEKTSKARQWFTKAAKQGHAKAQYELGLLYQKGIGAKKNRNIAKKWLNKSAKQGNKNAKLALAKYPSVKPKFNSAQRFMKKNLRLARKGNIRAQYTLGKAYRSGKNTKVNLKKSFYWFNKAANQDHTGAQYELALIYLNGDSITKINTTKAKTWLTKAANKNHKNANRKLNQLALIAQDKKREIQLDALMDDALLGDGEQQFELAMRYLLGYQIEIDNQQAIYWLNKAVSQNHALAQYQLANQYMSGNFVNQDIPRAIHLFAAAAKQNIGKAKFALGYFSENGFDTIVKAEGGDKKAQYQLATQYLNNSDLQKKEKGLLWLQVAADQSYPKALFKLGSFYQKGYLIKKSNSKAFKSYAQAARLDDADAQFHLSQMYKKGIGTTQDLALASRWLSRAASQGQIEAQKSLQFSGI